MDVVLLYKDNIIKFLIYEFLLSKSGFALQNFHLLATLLDTLMKMKYLD